MLNIEGQRLDLREEHLEYNSELFEKSKEQAFETFSSMYKVLHAEQQVVLTNVKAAGQIENYKRLLSEEKTKSIGLDNTYKQKEFLSKGKHERQLEDLKSQMQNLKYDNNRLSSDNRDLGSKNRQLDGYIKKESKKRSNDKFKY